MLNVSKQQSIQQKFVTALAALGVGVGMLIAGAVTPNLQAQDVSPAADLQPTTNSAQDAAENAIYSNYTALIDPQTVIAAEQLSDVFRRVSELVEPSVVRIVGYNSRGEVSGSGFVIDPDGYLVTNNHVIEPAERLYVEFIDGRRFSAEVVGADPLTDLAVVSIDENHLQPLKFSRNSNLHVGDWVIAAGCPLGLQQTVTAGIVSATGRQLGIIGSGGRAGYEDFIQTDAAINRGNSGGPLLNLRGEVIGVNSAILTQTGGSDGLGFAIPASIAMRIVGDLRDHGYVERGLLGVGIQDLTPPLAESYGLSDSQNGVLITNVEKDLPAGQVGLKAEDIITGIDGESVSDSQHLRSVVAMHRPKSTVEVDVLRDGRPMKFNVVLDSLDATEGAPPIQVHHAEKVGLGVDISNARTDQPGQVVAYVDGILPGGAADLAGFELRDVIEEVNSVPLETLARNANMTPAGYVNDLFENSPSGTVIRFKVERPIGRGRYTTQFVGVKIP